MYGGEEETVTLLLENRLIGVVMDRFGKQTSIRKEGEDCFTVRIKAVVSGQFFGWLSGLGSGVRITAPVQVKEKYIKWLSDILKEQDA